MTNWPPDTRTSLFASPTRFPHRTAWYVASSPVTPTMAEITVSTSLAVAVWTRAGFPQANSGHSARGRPAAVRLSDRRASPSDVATTATFGRNSRIWDASRSTLLPATSAYTWYRWRLRRTTSRVLVPIDPVEPRMVRVFIATPW